MERDAELDVISEIVVHLQDGSTSRAEATKRIPVDELVGQERVEAEVRTLFKNSPSALAPSAALPEPGDFITENIAGVPLLVVRGNDGMLRAFANICRHRGNQLCDQESGNRAIFTCGYHAWSYTTEGECRTFVDPEAFDDLDASDFSLIEYPCEERHGLVWVLPQPDADIDIAAWLGDDLDTELAGYAPHMQHVFRDARRQMPFNWKFGVNTFQELFHLTYLHKDSLDGIFIGNRSTFRSFEPHQRLTVIRTTFPEMAARPVEEQDLFPHVAIVYVLFPGCVLVWQLDHVELWRFSPVADDPYRCDVGLWLLTEEAATTESAERYWTRNWDIVWATVFDEDFVAMEAIQRNLLSGSLADITYGRNEIGLQDFHDQVTARSSSGTSR